MRKIAVLVVLGIFSGCAGIRHDKNVGDTSLISEVKKIREDIQNQKIAAARERSISREYRLLFYKLVSHMKEIQKDYNSLQAKYMMLELHGAQLEKNIRDLKKPRRTGKRR